MSLKKGNFHQSIYKVSVILLNFLLYSFLLYNYASAAEQVVKTEPDNHNVSSGELISFDVMYSTANPVDETLTGLGLRIHWNSSVLDFENLSDVFPSGLIAQSAPQTDDSNFDDDANTDQFINISWADFNGNWPESDSVKLYAIGFTTTANFNRDTSINFSASSNAAGYILSATPTTIVLSQSDTTQSLSTPNLFGLSLSEAQATLGNLGLSLGSLTTLTSETVASGNVVSQFPLAGSTVIAGDTVDLVVSTGPDIVVTPVSTPAPLPLAIDLTQNNILSELQNTPEIVGNGNLMDISQDADSNLLVVNMGEQSFRLRPFEMKSALNGGSPGIYITTDGLLELVVKSGEVVYLIPEPQQETLLAETLLSLGYEIIRGIYGELHIKRVNLSRTAGLFSTRAAIAGSPVQDLNDKRTGLVTLPSEKLSNLVFYAFQYYRDEVLYRQVLYPTPIDWEALKTELNKIGENASLDLEGTIHLDIDNTHYQGLMDYQVGYNSISSGELTIKAVADQNGDRIGDFEIVYPSGEKQILYLLP